MAFISLIIRCFLSNIMISGNTQCYHNVPLIILVVIAGTNKERLGCSKTHFYAMDVQLVDSVKSETIAILFDVEVKKCLSHIRDLIAKQVSDLMPSDTYFFVHQGLEVSEAMEYELTIEQIASPISNDLGDDNSSLNVILLSFGKCYDGINYKHATDNTAVDTTTQSIHRKMVSESSCATPQKEKTIKMLTLKSPTTADLRGLKIYTEDEIKKGKGSQAMYRQFWNKKIKEFAKNRALSNDEICKRVNEEWRFHKTTLLVKESKDVDEVMSQCLKSVGGNNTQDGPKAKKMKAKTLPSNVSRMNAAVQQAEDLTVQITLKNKELQNAVNPASAGEIKSELSRLQASLDSTKSEIRKAQDTMRKNLQTKQSEINKYFRK